MKDQELLEYINFVRTPWGRSSKTKNNKQLYSFWVDCTSSSTLMELKRNYQTLTDHLKKNVTYLNAHDLHESHSVQVAYVLGKHIALTH